MTMQQKKVLPGKQNAAAETGHNFGTFDGVFLPSILTMLGAIMFLRINYITGEAGILWTLLLLLGISEADGFVDKAGRVHRLPHGLDGRGAQRALCASPLNCARALHCALNGP